MMRSRWPRIALGVAAGQAAWPTVKWAKSKYESDRKFTVKVPNEGGDDLYNELHEWVLSLLPPSEQKALVAYTASRHRGPVSWDGDDGYRSKKQKNKVRLRYDGARKQDIRVRGHKVEVSVSDGQPAGSGRAYQAPEIIFTMSSPAARDDLLLELNSVLESSQEKSRTPVFRMLNGYDEWERLDDLPSRSLDSVILPPGQLERVTGDISRFLAAEDDYGRRSVPWHRAHLYKGPPGTGKTSVAKAVAGHFGLDIWYLPLGDVKKDTSLIKIILGVKGRSVLLLEDIDVFHAATRRTDYEGTTMSGLLNSLDGIATPHGLITIMTTNEPDVLDPALVRAGRVDFVEQFSMSGPDEIARHLAYWYDVKVTVGMMEQLPSNIEIAPNDTAEIFKQNETAAEALIALRSLTASRTVIALIVM